MPVSTSCVIALVQHSIFFIDLFYNQDTINMDWRFWMQQSQAQAHQTWGMVAIFANQGSVVQLWLQEPNIGRFLEVLNEWLTYFIWCTDTAERNETRTKRCHSILGNLNKDKCLGPIIRMISAELGKSFYSTNKIYTY